jgi:hypothetical protein
MSQGAAFRGQPLLLLAALILGWLALRAALWQPPFEAEEPPVFAKAAEPAAPTVVAAEESAETGMLVAAPSETAGPAPFERPVLAPLEPLLVSEPLDRIDPIPEPIVPPLEPAPPRAVIGHNLLMMAGLSQMEVPPALLAYLQAAQPPNPGIPAAAPMLTAIPSRANTGPSRWSADGWLFLRQDTTTPILSGRPSYGRSQAGAVVRYRLASESALQPQAYLRASTALAGPREQEIAAGVAARPLAAVPLRLAVEARIDETARGARLRPAVFAVTEFPPLRLPLGARAELYAQGGYVGGDYATAFVDGQARVERPLARIGEAELTAGAGAWGGAQKGAARLDIGPTAAVSFRLGDARGRVAADYRFRVAGEAEPSGGPSLTLSAGF